MEFKDFKQLQQKHVSNLLIEAQALFAVDKELELWDLYLDSFPPGTNEIFRERRKYDCSCCKHFIRRFGNVVIITNDYGVKTIWGFKTGESKFQPVVDALDQAVKDAFVADVFITKDNAFGTNRSRELLADNTVHTWEHFYIKLPSRLVTNSNSTIDTITAKYRDIKEVFERSLNEISQEAIETVLDLIAEKSLYRGEEWRGALEKFLTLHKEYWLLPEEKKDNFCWLKSTQVGGAIGKIKNHSMGVLLTDLSSGVNLNEAVRKYEKIVAPTNYKRPKAIFTQRVVEEAEQKIIELGLLDSLPRRFATIDDITINNILFASNQAKTRWGIFDELKREAVVKSPTNFDYAEPVGIEDFIALPKAKIELYLENRHNSNLVSLIAPQDKEAELLFKWNNNFSWAYNGNIADSMKQRVKDLGGNVEGVIRFSLQWNDNGDDNNDLDAHCIEPGGNEIYFSNMRNRSTTGVLDVDVIQPLTQINNAVAVENITWSNINAMEEGIYTFFVHNYSYRGGNGGFAAEIEYDGQIHSYEYRKRLAQNEKVLVAKLRFSREKGIEIIESLPSTTASKTVWNISTNRFHPVTIMMHSPNYWDGRGTGNKHYFFMLEDCLTDDTPNGFYNEFLHESLMPHRRVFEALGNKMKVAPSNEQLSGLGFSSTRRDYVICKIDNNKLFKVVF